MISLVAMDALIGNKEIAAVVYSNEKTSNIEFISS
jgi:hypothetical protein